MQKFQSWRLKKLQGFAPLACEMHYHRCSDYSFACTADLLRKLLVNHVETYGSPAVVKLSSEMASALWAFLDEMKFAYIHPRSTSHKFLMQAESRTTISPYC